jgi:hypothetical protein
MWPPLGFGKSVVGALFVGTSSPKHQILYEPVIGSKPPWIAATGRESHCASRSFRGRAHLRALYSVLLQ